MFSLGKTFRIALLTLMAALVGIQSASAVPSRIKDIVTIEGIRENQLIGYGLVVGLNGTGDIFLNVPYTQQSLTAMLERLGVNSKEIIMRPENVAAVMVTASLPSFSRQGTRIDVSVSSLGDAESLLGGTLIATPLLGADGEVYAVAQGGVAVAGFSAQGEAATVTQGVPTNGRIANGAIVERELPFELADMNSVKLSLHNPDLTTARRITAAINTGLTNEMARTLDPSTIQIERPVGYRLAMVDILTEIEQLTVTPDQRAKVIIDERTGIIVIGADVRINSVAIAQGNLTISITEEPQVSQPGAFAQGGQTEVVNRTGIEVDDGSDKRLTVLEPAVTLQDLVDGLNALGIGPRDMISILQAVKASGAMQAEIQVM
ncbi:MAG: flagellar basal body P-ring protein FlgI [Kordiimonadaceae bacterium]|nr:flagellar basal body P-ring protein FlgI [Kordiimonadaceae bacterium]MBO6570674.1 flagellar basal body P-ring protein FlgI [Kordiimonadaceae bacterium]MBO6966468.1 flagellar basal body P-ring protein FlgI [Kordiimonadaceae bacterium]